MTELYTYVMGPIDSWEGWMSPDELASSPYREVSAWGPDDVRERLIAAEGAARTAGWEGDGSARFSMLPQDNVTCEVVVAIKQGNNGTTFIMTPFEMPWLGKPFASARIKSRWQS